MQKILKPTIHLNGTPAERLRDQYCDAGKAVLEALHKLTDARPNARDYYPQGESAYSSAALEHEVRIAKLRAVLEDMHDLVEHVQSEIDRCAEQRASR